MTMISQIATQPTRTLGRTGIATRSGLAMALRSPTAALLTATFCWSASFVVGRALRDDVDPVTMTVLRWAIALAIFAPLLGRQTIAALPVIRREWKLVLALGGTGIALFHPMIFMALRTTTATNALLVLSLAPVAILIAGSALARRRPTAREVVGMLISMSGAAAVITRGDLAAIVAAGVNVGDLWMLAAVGVWAAYSLLLRRRPADLPQGATLVSSIVVALPMLIAFAAMTPGSVVLVLSAGSLLGILYIGIFGSAVGFLAWSHGVAALGPARAGQFIHLMPLFGAALSFVFLGEPLSLAQVVGAALVLSGIALIEIRR